MKNVQTDFINFLIDKYSPTQGATASKSEHENSSPNNEDDETVVEKLLMEYKKIKDQYENHSLPSKRR